VPDAVLDRKKQGFGLPLVHWMRNELKEMVLGTLLDTRTLQRGYLNPVGIRRLLAEHFQMRRDHSPRIWRLMMFELWHRNFLEKISSRPRSQTYEVVGAEQRVVLEGSSPSGARMRSVISESGDKTSLAGGSGRYGEV
jgi:hypothetical protein